MQEIWKDIEGFEGLYQISSCGRVKSKYRIRKQNGKRYLKVSLSKKGKTYFLDVHRLVAKAFIPNPLNKKTVNHINGIKTDNRVENLEWATHSENLIHSYTVLNRNKKARAVAQIKNGKIINTFNSIVEATKCFGVVARSDIRKVVMGIRKKAFGFEWKYI